MRAIARKIGSPGLAAMLAVPLIWSTSPSPHAHPPKPAHATPTIAGRWSLLFGTFEFHPSGRTGTFTDQVIRQRLGVFCPKVNDQDGQIVLHQVRKRTYTGTWQWFDSPSCEFAGYGLVSVSLWRSGTVAEFRAYPPKGTKAVSDIFLIRRLS